jgi:hypothetical protein
MSECENHLALYFVEMACTGKFEEQQKINAESSVGEFCGLGLC